MWAPLTVPTCIGEEQLRSCEAKSHPEKLSETLGPKDVHAVEILLRVGIRVETHSAEKTRQTKEVISMQMGDENLGDTSWVLET